MGKFSTNGDDNMDKEKNKELIHAFWKNFSEKKYVEAAETILKYEMYKYFRLKLLVNEVIGLSHKNLDLVVKLLTEAEQPDTTKESVEMLTNKRHRKIALKLIKHFDLKITDFGTIKLMAADSMKAYFINGIFRPITHKHHVPLHVVEERLKG